MGEILDCMCGDKDHHNEGEKKMSTETMKIRFRHLRTKTKLPVATMATTKNGENIYVSFTFWDQVENLKKMRGREVASERLNDVLHNKEADYAGETSQEEILKFIARVKENKINSPNGYKRLARKMFNDIKKPTRTK